MSPSLKALGVRLLRRTLLVSCCAGMTALSASASVTTFTGEDLNVNPGGAHPNATAAANSFYTAAGSLGTVSQITFESAPTGAFTSLTVAPGVTISGANYTGSNQQILNSPADPAAPSLDGFNTTPGGTKFVEVEGGSLVFNFTTPTQFFGTFLTGVQTSFYQDTITFSDGSTQIINVPGAGTTGSLGATDFVGFTDPGKLISSVTLYAGSATTGADFIGVDDVSYQGAAVAVTPEPGSFVLVGTGLLTVLGAVRRKIV